MSQYCKKLAFNLSNTALQDFLKIKETLNLFSGGCFYNYHRSGNISEYQLLCRHFDANERGLFNLGVYFFSWNTER